MDLLTFNLIICKIFIQQFLFSATYFSRLLLPHSQLLNTCCCHQRQIKLFYFIFHEIVKCLSLKFYINGTVLWLHFIGSFHLTWYLSCILHYIHNCSFHSQYFSKTSGGKQWYSHREAADTFLSAVTCTFNSSPNPLVPVLPNFTSN